MKKLWAIISANAALKVLALCFTCLIYAILSDGNVVTETLPHVPVQFTVPDTLCQPEERYEVMLQVKGSRREIAKLKKSRIEGVVRLPSDLKSQDRYKVVLDGEDFNIPKVEVVKISPAFVELPIQRKVTRLLPVILHFKGVPAATYQLVENECTAYRSQVSVTGPEKLLANLAGIHTAGIDVHGAISSFDKENVPLLIEHPGITVNPSAVGVNVQIRKGETKTKIIANVPVCLLVADAQKQDVVCVAEPAAVDVEISGIEQEVAKITAADLLAFVNLTTPAKTLKKEGFTAPVEVRFARDLPGIRINRSKPAQCRISIQKISK